MKYIVIHIIIVTHFNNLTLIKRETYTSTHTLMLMMMLMNYRHCTVKDLNDLRMGNTL